MCILRTRVRFCWLHMSPFLSRGLTYKLWISRYWYIFSNKFWSEHLAHTCLEAKCRNQKLRMLTTKYCLLGRNFICIAYVSIELQKSSPGGRDLYHPQAAQRVKVVGNRNWEILFKISSSSKQMFFRNICCKESCFASVIKSSGQNSWKFVWRSSFKPTKNDFLQKMFSEILTTRRE